MTKFALLGAATIAVLVAGLANAKPAQPQAPAARAAATLTRLTTKEKLALIHGQMLLFTPPAKRPPGIPMGAGYIAGNPRLAIPPQVETDASLGVANIMDMRKGDVATALPSGLALASSWDPAILRDGGRMIGSEARAKGFNVMLAGGTNLVRDPRGGRNFEYLGEDPLLAGRLVGAQIAGIQSNDIISTIKHFALNDQETGRSSASVNMAEEAMRESDLLAFQLGIEIGDPGAVMCSYNKVNGIFACENSFLLTDVLRGDWGFKGYVMSDWGAVHSTRAILEGLDQESGEQLDTKRFFTTELAAALQNGSVPHSAVDRAAGRVLYAMYAHGLFENPASAGQKIDFEADAGVAQRAAEAGIVLLRNQGNLLPLAAAAGKIVVIGGQANMGVPSGGGSSQVVPVGGFTKIIKLAKGVIPGFGTRSYGGTPPLDALRAELPSAQISYLEGSDTAAAAEAARAADIAIVFADKFASEGEDQRSLELEDGQDALIAAVADANKRTIVVLETGNPVLMPWRDKVPAILSAWYSGQRGGAAIARVLSGAVNPSGRLPVTFPASTSQLPNVKLPGADLPPPSKEDRAAYGLQVNSPPFDITYPEGSDVGYRWFAAKGYQPLYAFGYGLSYTGFSYAGLQVAGGKTVTASFTVTNTGTRTGADVPQIYVTLAGKAKRLVGWQKIQLRPGQSQRLTITAEPRVLASFDTKKREWMIAKGKITIELSRSAVDPVLSATANLWPRHIAVSSTPPVD